MDRRKRLLRHGTYYYYPTSYHPRSGRWLLVMVGLLLLCDGDGGRVVVDFFLTKRVISLSDP